jgi:hypothetical protein
MPEPAIQVTEGTGLYVGMPVAASFAGFIYQRSSLTVIWKIFLLSSTSRIIFFMVVLIVDCISLVIPELTFDAV